MMYDFSDGDSMENKAMYNSYCDVEYYIICVYNMKLFSTYVLCLNFIYIIVIIENQRKLNEHLKRYKIVFAFSHLIVNS